MEEREQGKELKWNRTSRTNETGIKGRDDRSRGIEILMADLFAKINPIDPLRLVKKVSYRHNCNWVWSVQVNLTTVPNFLPDHFLENTISFRSTI
jgi:hypothetical protein